MSDIHRVGVFHFASDFKGDPVGALGEALAKYLEQEGLNEVEGARQLSESLLVIPEAFNLRLGYRHCWRNIGCGIRARLVELSQQHKLAMVAGLLDDHGGPRPYNCAYLIDAGKATMLTRKRRSDDSQNYDCCDKPADMDDTIIDHRGLRIAALVCLDAYKYAGKDDRQQDVSDKLAGVRRKVFCIPSCFTTSTEEVVEGWPNLTIALANRSQKDDPQPSVLQGENGHRRIFNQLDHIEFLSLR